MNFKTKILMFLVLSFALFLSACGTPAQTPVTQAPAQVQTSAPTVAVPVPTEQTTARVYFNYEYTPDIPRSIFNGTDVKQETVTFNKTNGQWEQKNLSPQIPDFGPLFIMYLNVPLLTTSGTCGVNVIDTEKITTKITVQPICGNIESETVASITFGIANCNKMDDGSLSCKKDSDSGSIRYTINEKMDKFQFVIDGSYNFLYETWIRQALKTLGFAEIPDKYFDNIVPGANNTLYKNQTP